MRTIIALVFVAAGVAACGPHFVLRGSTRLAAELGVDNGGATVVLPPLDSARFAVLANGWPVWIVRHDDGRATVISAVGPPRVRSAVTLFAAGRALVRWLPRSRQFLAGDVIYDERGRVVGYAANHSCTDDCPRIEGPAPDRPDLDTFAATFVAGGLSIGARRPAPSRDAGSHWVDWDHREHVDAEIDVDAGAVAPLSAVAIGDAVRRPIGTYSIVAASIVRSTLDVPRVCADRPYRGACDASSPPALGFVAVPINAAAVRVETGTVLVRRERDGLAVIAMDRPRT